MTFETGTGFPLNDTINTCLSKEKSAERGAIKTKKKVFKAMYPECVSPSCWYLLRQSGDWSSVEYQALSEIYQEESQKNN